jgi:hypothetical protein
MATLGAFGVFWRHDDGSGFPKADHGTNWRCAISIWEGVAEDYAVAVRSPALWPIIWHRWQPEASFLGAAWQSWIGRRPRG